jgi:hypothetical protein
MKIEEISSKYNIIYIIVIIFFIGIVAYSHFNIYNIELKIKNDSENKELHTKKIHEIINLVISYILLFVTIVFTIYSYKNKTDILVQLSNIIYVITIYIILISINYTVYSFNYYSIAIIIATIIILIWNIRESIKKTASIYSLDRLNRIPQRIAENI